MVSHRLSLFLRIDVDEASCILPICRGSESIKLEPAFIIFKSVTLLDVLMSPLSPCKSRKMGEMRQQVTQKVWLLVSVTTWDVRTLGTAASKTIPIFSHYGQILSILKGLLWTPVIFGETHIRKYFLHSSATW